MPTFEELRDKLHSGYWTERCGAVEALAGMTDRRDEVVPLLKEQLRLDDDGNVISACIDALVQLRAVDDEVSHILEQKLHSGNWIERRGAVRALSRMADRRVAPLLAVDDEVFHILKQKLHSDNWGERYDAVRALARMADRRGEVVPPLKERLRLDDGGHVIIGACIDALHSYGVSLEEMSRLLAENPDIPRIAVTLPGYNDMASQVVGLTLRRYWWRLSPHARRVIGPPLSSSLEWHELYRRFRWLEWHELEWHELFHRLERSGSRWIAMELAVALYRWLGSPWWRYALNDFESLMSLRVEESALYEELNVLRFRFLDEFATDREGESIRDRARRWLGEFRQNWEELLRTEEEFDRVRDEISGLRRQREEIIREAERRAEGEWRWEPWEEPPRLPQDLRARWEEIAGRLRFLEGDEEPGQLQRLRETLGGATERLLPQFREAGVRFRLIEVEGVLGEYNFYERKITVYPPMIELAARDLERALPHSIDEVSDALRDVVEMHETAHATAHLGMDSTGSLWKSPGQGSSELHELLAQLYTFHLIRRLEDSRLEQVFLELNKKQPERYRYWRVLQDIPLETVRGFLLGKRSGEFRGDILELAEETARVLGSAIPLLRTVLPAEEFQNFTEEVKAAVARLSQARTWWELGEAAEGFLACCESHPFVRSILQHALSDTPSSLHRRLLLASTLTKGTAVQGPTLRIALSAMEVLPDEQEVRQICNRVLAPLQPRLEEEGKPASPKGTRRAKRKQSGERTGIDEG